MIIAVSNEPLKDRQVSLKRSLLFALDQTRVERAERSARIIVTMGMPVLLYRWYFGAYGVRGFESSMLRFAGIKPIRESFFGLTSTKRNALAGSMA